MNTEYAVDNEDQRVFSRTYEILYKNTAHQNLHMTQPHHTYHSGLLISTPHQPFPTTAFTHKTTALVCDVTEWVGHIPTTQPQVIHSPVTTQEIRIDKGSGSSTAPRQMAPLRKEDFNGLQRSALSQLTACSLPSIKRIFDDVTLAPISCCIVKLFLSSCAI